MSITQNKLNRVVEHIISDKAIERVENFDVEKTKAIKSISFKDPYSKEGQENRLQFIKDNRGIETPYLSGEKTLEDNAVLQGNIENYIGMSQVPTGVFGPLVMNGANATGAYYIPMATSEGALVASYARGAKACKESGAILSCCLMEGVQRCPAFKFDSLLDVGKFVVWVMQQVSFEQPKQGYNLAPLMTLRPEEDIQLVLK